jgi:acyl carrier protein
MSLDSLDGFLRLVRDELGVHLEGPAHEATDLADLPDWDSVNLLRLVTLLEQETGRRMPVGRILQARSLKEIYVLVEDQG